MKKILSFSVAAFLSILLNAQSVAKFSCPDTVYTNQEFIITNQSIGTTNCLWRFCKDTLAVNPTLSVNLGILDPNPDGGNPICLSLAQDGNKYYLFYTAYHPTCNIIRITFNGSYLDPSPTVDSISSAILSPKKNTIQDISVKYDSVLNEWFGFYVTNRGVGVFYFLVGDLMRIDFGNSLSNDPAPTDIHYVDSVTGHLIFPHGIDIVRDRTENKWYLSVGFTHNFDHGFQPWSFARYEFDDSLTAEPVYSKISETILGAAPGAIGALLNSPASLHSIQDEKGDWYTLALNMVGSFFTRINWGSSMSVNNPSGIRLPAMTNVLSPYDFQLYLDNFRYYASIVSGNSSNGFSIAKFDNLNADPTVKNYGNIAGFTSPIGISDYYRMGDTLVCFAGNGNGSISRIVLNQCADEILASSSQCSPSQIKFSKPGTYVIRLYASDGSLKSAMYSKTIVVEDSASLQLRKTGNDFAVYPTRADKNITIEYNATDRFDLAIINIYGVSMYSEKIICKNKKDIDISDLVPGIYYVRVSDGSNTQVMRFVKQ